MIEKDIESYIKKITSAEFDFRNQTVEKKESNLLEKTQRVGRLFIFVVLSISDFLSLLIRIKPFAGKQINYSIVYTGVGSLISDNGIQVDRNLRHIELYNVLYVSTNKEKSIKSVNGQKVYNIGGLVKLLSYLRIDEQDNLLRVFSAYRIVNDAILKGLNQNEVYVICLWELNTLSVIFSKYRKNFRLIKIQHGSMINYPPYVEVAPVKIADLIYVKNQQTVDFLKRHLCLDYPSEYRIISYVQKELKILQGIHILYASTVEIGGFHPVFREFLEKNANNDIHIYIRLHPREKLDKMKFEEELSKHNLIFEFDDSSNWMERNNIKNLIIVSPWSSILEEAYDNGFISLTIDPIGERRYNYLIDNKRFFYTNNLIQTLESLDA